MIIQRAEVSSTVLAGQVPVVTGIGREAVRSLAYLGAAVVIAETTHAA